MHAVSAAITSVLEVVALRAVGAVEDVHGCAVTVCTHSTQSLHTRYTVTINVCTHST